MYLLLLCKSIEFFRVSTFSWSKLQTGLRYTSLPILKIRLVFWDSVMYIIHFSEKFSPMYLISIYHVLKKYEKETLVSGETFIMFLLTYTPLYFLLFLHLPPFFNKNVFCIQSKLRFLQILYFFRISFLGCRAFGSGFVKMLRLESAVGLRRILYNNNYKIYMC